MPVEPVLRAAQRGSKGSMVLWKYPAAGLAIVGGIVGGTSLDDSSIKTACDAWVADAAAAQSTYGPIAAWDTSNVTSMAWLFDDTDFNEDISAWDTSAITTMAGMFYYAHDFAQDLGWCLDESVTTTDAFRGTACADPSCGVARGAAGTCAPTPAPSPIETSAGAVLTSSPIALCLLGGAAVHLFLKN